MATQSGLGSGNDQPRGGRGEGDHGALRQVNDFAHNNRIVVGYKSKKLGPDHHPLWEVTAAIRGIEYRGSGMTLKDAENTCALAILNSGILATIQQQ